MPPSVEDHVDAYAAGRTALAARTTASVAHVVNAFDGWYSGADITRLAARLVRQVEAAQRQTAALTDAYLSRVTSEMRGRRVAPVGVIDVRELRDGVTHEGVYGRVANHYRWRISEGDEPETARDTAVSRAVQASEVDLTLAFREMTQRFMDERDVTEYRRIIRPERSATGSCGLCVVAADRVYTRIEKFAIHGGCNCTVLPITEDDDPGLRLNREDFERIYRAAGGTNRAQLSRTRIVVREHGEIGPVLVRDGEHFRDAEEVARDRRNAP